MLKFVVVYFWFWAASQTTVANTNKVLCGSSLARCCRLAVAPKYLMQSAIAEALPIYGVTGLNFEGVVQTFSSGVFNFE